MCAHLSSQSFSDILTRDDKSARSNKVTSLYTTHKNIIGIHIIYEEGIKREMSLCPYRTSKLIWNMRWRLLMLLHTYRGVVEATANKR